VRRRAVVASRASLECGWLCSARWSAPAAHIFARGAPSPLHVGLCIRLFVV